MKQERILVVDDEALVRETIRVDLMEAGYEVVEARNGLEGVRQFQNGAIDLVISDLVMDEMAAPGVKNISIDTIGDVATDSTGVLAVTLNIPQVSLQELF